MSVLFREHRGSLVDAIKTVREVSCNEDIENAVSNDLVSYKVVSITPYGYDRRIDWNTHIVLGEYGEGVPAVIGWTNGPLD